MVWYSNKSKSGYKPIVKLNKHFDTSLSLNSSKDAVRINKKEISRRVKH